MDVGNIVVQGCDETFGDVQLTFRITNPPVRKALLSVSQITAKGNRVVLQAENSYMEQAGTGRRIQLRREGGVFVMDIWCRKNPSGIGSFSQCAGGAAESKLSQWRPCPFGRQAPQL